MDTSPELTREMTPELIEACGDAPERFEGFMAVLRCVGCILARAEDNPCLGISDIEACTGLSYGKVRGPLLELEKAALLDWRKPGDYSVALGPRNVGSIRAFTPTARGQRLLPYQAQQDCVLTNPLARLTQTQTQVARCFRCILGQPGRPPGVVKEQVMACSGMSEARVRIALAAMMKADLVQRVRFDLQEKWGKRQKPFLYSPTAKGQLWLTPRANPNCALATPEDATTAMLDRLTPARKALLGRMACLLSGAAACDPRGIISRPPLTRCSGLHGNNVQQFLKLLVKTNYLVEQRPQDDLRMLHYVPTSKIIAVLAQVEIPCRPKQQWEPLACKALRGEIARLIDPASDDSHLLTVYPQVNNLSKKQLEALKLHLTTTQEEHGEVALWDVWLWLLETGANVPDG